MKEDNAKYARRRRKLNAALRVRGIELPFPIRGSAGLIWPILAAPN
jgi:hypothetical protein